MLGIGPMTPKEKALYHQIHPLKLATDILASVVSLYFFWQHQIVIALALHFVPPLIASGLLIRYGALDTLRDSPFGRYVARHMTRVMEAVRLFGDIVTILGAWCNGLLPSARKRQ